MSVEKVQRQSGNVWRRVRWRDEEGQPHSRVVGRKTDAVAVDEELKRAKRLQATSSRSATTTRARPSRSSPGPGGTCST